MIRVDAGINQDYEDNVCVFADIIVPCEDLKKSKNEIRLVCSFPDEQAVIGEGVISGCIACMNESEIRSLGSSIGNSIFGILGFHLTSSKSISRQVPLAQNFKSEIGQGVKLSLFPNKVIGNSINYNIKFPVKNLIGNGKGAKLFWEMGSNCQEINIPFSKVWYEAIQKRLPTCYAHFHGHRELRHSLRDAFKEGKNRHGVLVHGMGGIGKTALIRSILESLEDPPWTCVQGFSAKMEEYDYQNGHVNKGHKVARSKRDMYNAICEDLKIKWDGRLLEEAFNLVRDKLSDQKKILFIIDNLETTEELESLLSDIFRFMPPPPQGTVVVTSRELPENWDRKKRCLTKNGIESFSLSPLDPASIESIIKDLIYKTNYNSNILLSQPQIDTIISKSEGHPLSAKFFTYSAMNAEYNFLDEYNSREKLLNFCFQAQYEKLSYSQQIILNRLSKLKSGLVNHDNLVKSLGARLGQADAKRAIDNLHRQSFIAIVSENGCRYVNLHSIVRSWVNGRHENG